MDIEKLKYEAQNKALHIADVSGSALFNADCMDILPLIPDKSVQLILADLPYGEIELQTIHDCGAGSSSCGGRCVTGRSHFLLRTAVLLLFSGHIRTSRIILRWGFWFVVLF